MSKFSALKVEESGGFDKKERVYLSPKKDFPMNKTFDYRIIDANPMRQLFQGNKPACTAFDAENGRTRESGWKETRPCAGCEYRDGVGEGENKLKCQYKLSVVMEHPDPEKEYEVKLPFGSYIEFSKYIEELEELGLDVPDVITKITRIENPRGNGGLFTFAKGDAVQDDSEDEEEEEIVITEAEQKALDDIKQRFADMGEDVDVEIAATMLTKIADLKGISKERAVLLVKTLEETE